ncbi:MAG: dihydrolipoamide succinyltransferase, partial [Rhodospirillaceae bacterium]|nr:dihydrolipoamide succinyltransferase [Rhodospirillaceae bacterium]
MATEIKVPTLGESLTEGTVATWLKSVGDAVAVDEPILELETDKVTMEVNAPVAGTLTEIIAEAGAEVEVGATLGVIGDGAAAPAPEAAASAPAAAPAPAASGGGEAVDIVVPMLGESLTEGTVANWLKSVGDAVAQDEPLLELETDKVTMEVNAPSAGTLTEILADVGSEVEVGAILGRLGGSGAAAAPAPAAAPTEAPTVAASSDGIQMSPAVRKLVEDEGYDATQIPATGKDGRLTKGDVLAYQKAGGAP